MTYPAIYAFWAINGSPTSSETQRQLRLMRRLDFDGVVYHPRFYPGHPPYLSEAYFCSLETTVEQASGEGLDVWLYDEDGWPSGTVGGELLRRFPEHRNQWLALFRSSETVEGEGLCRFTAPDGEAYVLVREFGETLDYLKADATDCFLDMCHRRYREGLSDKAWSRISAMFTDEPQLGDHTPVQTRSWIPWTDGLAEIYRERTGREFAEDAPVLFFDGDGAAEIRVGFRELLADLFLENYLDRCNAWCASEGIQFTGHMKGEETPYFQVPLTGSCSQVMRGMSLPGIDALERFPSNDFFPRQAASLSRQFGNGNCMVEAFGGSGWGAGPDDLLTYLRWLARNGCTHYAMHLWQYELNDASRCDWPPSLPVHMNWRPAWKDLIQQFRREYAEISRGVREADRLLISPHRAIQEQFLPQEFRKIDIHKGSWMADSPAAALNTRFMDWVEEQNREGDGWHVTDERTFEQEAEAVEDGVRLGNQVYREVRAFPECRLSTSIPLNSPASPGGASAVTPAPASPPVLDLGTAKVDIKAFNCLPLEPESREGEGFSAKFTLAEPLAIRLGCLQPLTEVRLNGVEVQGDLLPVEAMQPGKNRLEWKGGQTVWLSGRFGVFSLGEWNFEQGHWKTEGGFELRPLNGMTATNLLQEGFPFCPGPARMRWDAVEGAGEEVVLPLQGVAVRVRHAGGADQWATLTDAGWMFRLEKGSGPLRIDLYPSMYNVRGPHHYISGDAPVISPDQFTGVKNFADAQDSPDCTQDHFWRFRPWGS